MNDSLSIDSPFLQTTETAFPSPQSKVSPQPKSPAIQKYLLVDMEQATLTLTQDSQRASSLKQVHHFVMRHFKKLTKEESLLILSFKPNQPICLFKQLRGKTSLLNKIYLVNHLLLNVGKTDYQLMQEIRKKALYQYMATDFKEGIEENGLKEKIQTILLLKERLKIKENELYGIVPSRYSKRELRKEIEEVEQQLRSLQGTLRSKEFRQQIKKLLKKIGISTKDSEVMREVKNTISQENDRFIQEMNVGHIQFNLSSEIKLIFESYKTADVSEMPTVEMFTVDMPTIFCDRAKQFTPSPEWFKRASGELSVKTYIDANLPSICSQIKLSK